MPKYIVRILAYWYADQSMQVKWGNRVSAPFGVNNSVRQGGFCPQFFLIFDLGGYIEDPRECTVECGTILPDGGAITMNFTFLPATFEPIVCPHKSIHSSYFHLHLNRFSTILNCVSKYT